MFSEYDIGPVNALKLIQEVCADFNHDHTCALGYEQEEGSSASITLFIQGFDVPPESTPTDCWDASAGSPQALRALWGEYANFVDPEL